MAETYKLDVDSDFINREHAIVAPGYQKPDVVLASDGVEFLRFSIYDGRTSTYRFVYTPLARANEWLNELDTAYVDATDDELYDPYDDTEWEDYHHPFPEFYTHSQSGGRLLSDDEDPIVTTIPWNGDYDEDYPRPDTDNEYGGDDYPGEDPGVVAVSNYFYILAR